MPDAIEQYDIVVVGAGPGGIAAAVTAGARGKHVCLIDDNAFAGGQIWRNSGEVPPSRQARRWFKRLAASSVERLHQAGVVASLPDLTLIVETPGGSKRIRWSKLVLATGARELFLPFPVGHFPAS